MKIETITHPSGDQLPLLLDDDGLPIPAPNEFILSRRYLSTNTLVRNLRELAVLYRWLESRKIDLNERISSKHQFTEAEIIGGLIESLRRDQENRGTVKKIMVRPNTYNQRLTTVRQYLSWCFDVEAGLTATDDQKYDRIRENKKRLLHFLDRAFINAPPSNKGLRKGLDDKEINFLLSKLDPLADDAFGKDPAVRYRNYVATMIMLFYGLRPGELLSLKVTDIEMGAISGIRVTRRPPDPKDTRKPRPQIKRNGRVLLIEDPVFARHLEVYITEWRDLLLSLIILF